MVMLCLRVKKDTEHIFYTRFLWNELLIHVILLAEVGKNGKSEIHLFFIANL